MDGGRVHTVLVRTGPARGGGVKNLSPLFAGSSYAPRALSSAPFRRERGRTSIHEGVGDCFTVPRRAGYKPGENPA